MSACYGKVRFFTRRDARKARALMHPRKHLQAYICDQCGYFHLGTVPSIVLRGVLPKHLVCR